MKKKKSDWFVRTWQPIECAPKNGNRIVCFGAKSDDPDGNKDFMVLCWKTNPRIVSAHRDGLSLDLLESYFGDPSEYDDYDLAVPGNGPTHWHPLDPLPNKE